MKRRVWITAFVAGLMALVMATPLANAQATHRVSFKAGPVIMAWDGAGALRQGEAVDLTLGTGEAVFSSFDAPVLTGTLLPANFTPTSTIHETFEVASNTAFRIEGTSSAAWRVSVERVQTGPLARATGTSFGLADIRAGLPTPVFQTDQRTAAHPGAPRNQAITLRVRAEAMTPNAAPLTFQIIAVD